MTTRRVKTSYELADILEDVVRVLRALPEVHLAEPSQNANITNMLPGTLKDSLQEDVQHDIQDKVNSLANQLHTFGREYAESEMNSLTVPAIRQLASLLGIRIPSKAVKSESISMLLSQVFDVPAGQELIRTFHKRNVGISDAKSFAKSGQVERN